VAGPDDESKFNSVQRSVAEVQSADSDSASRNDSPLRDCGELCAHAQVGLGIPLLFIFVGRESVSVCARADVENQWNKVRMPLAVSTK
jgi:hypothetical protein